MMDISRIAEKAFAVFLRLYPPGFQAEFGEEIRGVFSETVRQAGRRGILPALAVSLREAADFPLNLAAAYGEEMQMQNLQLSQPVLRPVWWGAVGFGLSAAVINLVNTAAYFTQADGAGSPLRFWNFWGELIGYLVVGGLGGLLFALICRQPVHARLYLIGGSLGFLIGHLLWYPIMVGSGILLFYSETTDAAYLIANTIVRWIDLALMLGLSGLFIGWMTRNPPRAIRLAGAALLGAVIGGLAGAGICGLLLLAGSPFSGREIFITGLLFIVNALAGIGGGALLGRAILRGGDLQGLPAAA
jgi:hypothetical protein